MGLPLGRGDGGPDGARGPGDAASRGRAAHRVPRPVTPRSAARAVPALLLGAAAAALLSGPSLRLPGARGAARVTDGFVPGRWDARFLVARGPAGLRLPEEPLRARLLVSGPAALRVHAGGDTTAVLSAEATPVEVDA